MELLNDNPFIKCFVTILIGLILIPLKTLCQAEIQQEIENLQRQLKSELAPRKKIQSLLRLTATSQYNIANCDSLLDHAIEIAKANALPFLEAKSEFRKGSMYYFLGKNPKLIVRQATIVDSINKVLNNKLLPGYYYDLKVKHAIRVGEVEAASQYLDSLEVASRKFRKKDFASFHLRKGEVLQLQKRYSEALKEYQKVLEFESKDKTFVHNNIASLYLEMNNPAKAISHAKMSIEEGKKTLNTLPQIESYLLIGDARAMQNDSSEALRNWEKVEEIRRRMVFKENISAIDRLLLYHWKDSLKSNEILDGIAAYKELDILSTLKTYEGKRALEEGLVSKALHSCQEGLNLAIESDDITQAKEACLCLLSVHKITENTSELLNVSDQLNLINKEIDSDKRLYSLASTLANYENEESAKSAKRDFENEKKILEEKILRNKLLLYLSIIILILGGVFIYHIRERSRKIETQNKVINESLAEKEILLREIHHRVKNNLQLVSSLLSLQGNALTNEEAKSAIEEGQSRIRSMALIHQNLYETHDVSAVNVREYIKNLILEIYKNHEDKHQFVDLKYELDHVNLPISKTIPLGLIINELLTNSLKHAFPDKLNGQINVYFLNKEEKIELQVIDDGISNNSFFQSESSFGITLVKALNNQLNGEIRFSCEKGTQVSIIIPKI